MNLRKIHCPIFLLICETCIEGQQIKATFSNDRGRLTNKPLEIAHSDVSACMQDVVFRDDSTRSESDLEMGPSKRNAIPMVVGVD
jgi:hypothetical protein